MKYLFVFMFSILALSFINQNENSYLYQQALVSHLSKVDIDTVFVLKCVDIELPKINTNHIIVDISEDPESFLKGKESLYAIKIMPIEINNGDVQVTLIDYVLRENKTGLIMSNTGSEVFIYKYNASTKQYKLKKKQKYIV